MRWARRWDVGNCTSVCAAKEQRYIMTRSDVLKVQAPSQGFRRAGLGMNDGLVIVPAGQQNNMYNHTCLIPVLRFRILDRTNLSAAHSFSRNLILVMIVDLVIPAVIDFVSNTISATNTRPSDRIRTTRFYPHRPRENSWSGRSGRDTRCAPPRAAYASSAPNARPRGSRR